MMAWVSPVFMVRLIPLRIGVVPASVSTVTCRSRISRTDISDFLRHSRINEHVVAVDRDDVDRNGLISGEILGDAGAQRECGAVSPALQRVTLDESLGEGDLAVRADIADSVYFACGVEHDGHRNAVELYPQSSVLFEIAQA